MKKTILLIFVFALVWVLSVVASDNIGYINDSCVIDRSCCESIANSLDFVCFRNDTNSSFSEPFEPKDLYGDTIEHAFMGFEGSKFALKLDDVNNFDGWSGVGRTNFGKTQMVSKFFAVPVSRDKIRNNVWGFISNGDTTGGTTQRAETYTVPINEWSFIILTKIQCLRVDGCNIAGDDGVYMTHKSSLDYEIINDTGLIDGIYHGIKVNFTPSPSDAYENNITTTWIIAVNNTPNQIYNKTSTERNFRWDLNGFENITITAIITTQEYESNISDWIENPIKTINDAINYTTEWNRRLKYPTSLNDSQKTSYYFGGLNYRMNTVRAHPTNINNSAWGTQRVYAPTMATYPATWIWDSFISCIGMLQACKEDNVECLQVCKENLEVWVNHSKTRPNLEWFVTIRDNNDSSAGTQASGGWDLVTLHLYNRSVITKDYLCNSSFQALKNHYVGKNTSKLRQLSSTEWCMGDSAINSGWDGSVRYAGNCQIDNTGWQGLSAKSLSKIANICGNTTEETSFLNEFHKLQNGLKYMWSYDENDFCDLNASNECMYYNGDINSPSISVASVWAMLVNATTIEQDNFIMASWNTTDKLATFNPIPTLITTHLLYDPSGSVQNWGGPVWAPPNIITILSLAYKGYTSNLTYIRNKSIRMVSESAVMGCEAYMADNNTCAPVFSASAKISYLWGDSLLYTATWGIDLMNLIMGDTLDVLPPEITVIYPVNFIDAGSLWTYVNISTNENANCSWNTTNTGLVNMTLFNITGGVKHSFNFSNGSVLKDDNTYDLFFKCNDSSGNVASESTSFTLGVEASGVNWTDRFDWLNSNQSNEMCVLHRTTIANSMYTEIPNCLHSLMNMYESTGDIKYLNNTDRQLDNISKRYSEWGTMVDGDFRYGHIGGAYARYIYEANKSGDATLQDRGSYYLDFINENISTKISPFFKEFTYNGKNMGMLVDNYTAVTTQIKPFNQVYGFSLMNIYLYNITLNSTYYDRGLKMALAFNESFSYGNCNYDSNRKCLNTSYRFNYTQSWENYSGITFGFPPQKEIWNYYEQKSEVVYRFWKHGFLENSTMERTANSIYFDQYLQEGGLDNVLISRDTGYPSTTYFNFHVLYLTHGTFTIPYYAVWNSNISNISIEIIKTTYNTVDDRDSTYTFYQEPYATILDPRTDIEGTYHVDKGNVTPDQLMKYISTYIYFEEGEASQSEDFPLIDDIKPSFANNQNNASANTFNTGDIQINITASDDSNISAVILAWDVTGSFVNITTLNFDGSGNVTAIFNETINNIPLTGGTVSYKFQSNDTLNNVNISNIYTFTVQDNSPPPNTLRSSISSTILRSGLAVFLALFVLLTLITPVMINMTKSSEKRWEIEQWIKYYIVSIIVIFLVIILIEQIFNITA